MDTINSRDIAEEPTQNLDILNSTIIPLKNLTLPTTGFFFLPVLRGGGGGEGAHSAPPCINPVRNVLLT